MEPSKKDPVPLRFEWHDGFTTRLYLLSLLETRVLVTLFKHAHNDTLVCWPSARRIVRLITNPDVPDRNLDARRVRKALRGLEDKGFIKMLKQGRPGRGTECTTHWRLTLPMARREFRERCERAAVGFRTRSEQSGRGAQPAGSGSREGRNLPGAEGRNLLARGAQSAGQRGEGCAPELRNNS